MTTKCERRIVAVGDIHGDLAVLLTCLRISHCIDDSFRWNCDNTHVIICGDMIDRYRPGITPLDNNGRGPGEIPLEEEKIILFLNNLDRSARMRNSKVTKLLGNHELMAFHGDERYVTPYARSQNRKKLWQGPRSVMFKNLLKRDTKICATVCGWTFTHASILPKFVRAVRSCSPELGCFKFTTRCNDLILKYLKGSNKFNRTDRVVLKKILGPDGILWSRAFAEPEKDACLCDNVKTTLRIIGGRGLVMAHCPQRAKESCSNIPPVERDDMRVVYLGNQNSGCVNISMDCGRSIYRIDTAMSRAFPDSNLPQVLEIRVKDSKDHQIYIIKATQTFWKSMQTPAITKRFLREFSQDPHNIPSFVDEYERSVNGGAKSISVRRFVNYYLSRNSSSGF